MCCDENVIFIGCFQSCDNIQTLILLDFAGYYRLRYEFNGAVINKRFYGTLTDGKLLIPKGLFNENSSQTFELTDDEGVLIGCYKITIYPTQQYVVPSIIPAVNISNYNCINGDVTFTLGFGFTAWEQADLFKTGSKFKISFIGASSATYINFSAGLDYTSMFEITDFDALPLNFGCDVQIQSVGCETPIYIQLVTYSNLRDENLIFNIPPTLINP